MLIEIDLKDALKEKARRRHGLQIILGACHAPLAYEAIQAEPSIAAVRPCNVVVRSVDAETGAVEAGDPDAMMGLADNEALHTIATDAKQRTHAASPHSTR